MKKKLKKIKSKKSKKSKKIKSKKCFGAINEKTYPIVIRNKTKNLVFHLTYGFFSKSKFEKPFMTDLFESFVYEVINNLDLNNGNNIKVYVIKDNDKEHFNINIVINKIPIQDEDLLIEIIPREITVTKDSYDFKFILIELKLNEIEEYSNELIY